MNEYRKDYDRVRRKAARQGYKLASVRRAFTAASDYVDGTFALTRDGVIDVGGDFTSLATIESILDEPFEDGASAAARS